MGQPGILRLSDFLRSCKFGKIKPKQFLFFLFQSIEFLDFSDLVVSHLFQLCFSLFLSQRRIHDKVLNTRCDSSEYFLAIADAAFENSNSHQAAIIDIGVNRSFSNDVIDTDCLAPLTASINSADSLFDPHRVPRKIIINHHVAELVVQAF